VLDGDPAPPRNEAHQPQIRFVLYGLSVMLVYCGQTVGWVKMPLGTQVGLSPGHSVLDGDPAPPMERVTAAPKYCSGLRAQARQPVSVNCSPCLLWRSSCPSHQLLSSCRCCKDISRSVSHIHNKCQYLALLSRYCHFYCV